VSCKPPCVMSFKFEKLKIWKLSLDYIDQVYKVVNQLPVVEKFNLASQMRRAATSIALNIAEGSTGQSDAEQARFLGMAQRSLLETVACIKIIERNNYIDKTELKKLENVSEFLAIKIQAMRKAVLNDKNQTSEEVELYRSDIYDD
jgi:four helix bundle protein